MNRRLIIVISSVALVLLIIIGGLFLAVKSKNSTSNKSQVTLKLNKVIDQQINFPIQSYDDSAIWYFDKSNNLFRYTPSGTTQYPLPTLTGQLSSVLWPSQGSDFIAVTNLGKFYFSNNAHTLTNLSGNIQSLDWMPDGQRIVYIWKSGDNQTQSLDISDADGTGFQTVASVFWPDLQVKANPDGKSVLMYRSSPQGDTNKIYLVDLLSGQITTAVDQGDNLNAEWVPNSDEFVYAQKGSDPLPKLFMYDVSAKSITDLNLSTTLDQVALSPDGKTLYASVVKSNTNDVSILKLDLTSEQQTNYFDLPSTVRVSNPFLVSNTLYFINPVDGKLYDLEQ